MRKALVLAACLLAAGTLQAQEAAARDAAGEAAAVHSLATAARLCGVMDESQLRIAASRMDRVHSAQLGATDQETYLLLRGSESFRNAVFASALRRAQSGCPEVASAWRDVNSTLIAADLQAPGSNLAARTLGSSAR